jgi:uncharacterized membrane protein
MTMTSLTVLKFESADGAEKALEVIEDLNKRQLITLHDAAIVHGRKVKRSQKQNSWPI